ncbi:MAG: MGMT family protein [Lacipirellulaceae bacterium]
MAAVMIDQEIASAMTELGGMAVGVIDGSLAAVAFGHKTVASAERDVQRQIRDLEPAMQTVSKAISAHEALDFLADYAAGLKVDFSKLPIYDYKRTDFQKRVIDACRRIPRGETLSYGELAAKVGNPGAARAVGTVMSSNPLPLVIPCHRVLGAGGCLGGYSARQGVAMKKRLLEMEGVES